jgi:putative toxin-antitoxin system antitoxin component (TIGR02293 family)
MSTTAVTRTRRDDLRVLKSLQLEEQVSEIRSGLPYLRVERFAAASGLPLDQVIAYLRIPPRTLVRRKQSRRLSRDESERLDRLARLFTQAVELFSGRRDSAVAWMLRPCRALGGVAPLVMAETEVGCRAVEDVIGRLEEGVFM